MQLAFVGVFFQLGQKIDVKFDGLVEGRVNFLFPGVFIIFLHVQKVTERPRFFQAILSPKIESIRCEFLPEVHCPAFWQSMHDLNWQSSTSPFLIHTLFIHFLISGLALERMRRTLPYLVADSPWHTTPFFVYSTHPKVSSYHFIALKYVGLSPVVNDNGGNNELKNSASRSESGVFCLINL